MNALLEGATHIPRIASVTSELVNPAYNYAKGIANDIKNEFSSARALQKETYKPVFDKYGSRKCYSKC